MAKPDPAGPVTVLRTSDPALLGVAKSLLEDAGIAFFAKGEGVQDLFAAGRVGTGFSPIAGPVELQVAADDAEAASERLRELASTAEQGRGAEQHRAQSEEDEDGPR
jgi:hypothetical protein